MNSRRGLVLDANILMRAVLGHRVRELLERYEDSATFYDSILPGAKRERLDGGTGTGQA